MRDEKLEFPVIVVARDRIVNGHRRTVWYLSRGKPTLIREIDKDTHDEWRELNCLEGH
jgi:hypothetical protein